MPKITNFAKGLSLRKKNAAPFTIIFKNKYLEGPIFFLRTFLKFIILLICV